MIEADHQASRDLEVWAEGMTGFSMFITSRCRVAFVHWVLLAFILGALSNAWSESGAFHDAFAALLAIRKPDTPHPQIRETYHSVQNETIVYIGGTNVVEKQFENHFEVMATLSWPENYLRFRNLAWEADADYRQQRPLCFFDRDESDQRAGSAPDQRQRVEVGTVVIRFGKMESLDGRQGIGYLRNAYGEFFDELLEITPRVLRPTQEVVPIPVNNIRERTEIGTLFPAGLPASLSREELRDLLHYLWELSG